jgi:esterase/lipase
MTSHHIHDFSFPACSDILQASIDYCGNDIPEPTILSLHGGGPAGRKGLAWLFAFLAQSGYSTLRFDHSGFGDSSGDIKQASLKKRCEEVHIATEFLKDKTADTLIAISMGGHIALEILPLLSIQNLILFCPALYSKHAFDIPFGGGFSDIIRQPYSYQDQDVIKNLRAFTGNFLLITAENDQIIPPDVIDLYKDNSVNCARREFLTLKGSPHPIHTWVLDKLEQQKIITDAVLDLIKS